MGASVAWAPPCSKASLSTQDPANPPWIPPEIKYSQPENGSLVHYKIVYIRYIESKKWNTQKPSAHKFSPERPNALRKKECLNHLFIDSIGDYIWSLLKSHLDGWFLPLLLLTFSPKANDPKIFNLLNSLSENVIETVCKAQFSSLASS